MCMASADTAVGGFERSTWGELRAVLVESMVWGREHGPDNFTQAALEAFEKGGRVRGSASWWTSESAGRGCGPAGSDQELELLP
jgi:hypothetical protein